MALLENLLTITLVKALYAATKKIKKIKGFVWKKVGLATRIVPEKPIIKISQYLNAIISFWKIFDQIKIKKGVVISIGVKIFNGICLRL